MKRFCNGLFLIFLLFFVFPGSLKATTISPYKNLGEMVKASQVTVLAKALRNFEFQDGEKVFYKTEFQVIELIKGKISQRFYTQKMALSIGNLHQMVFGEAVFEEDQNYLLMLSFKNGVWRPMMLSHGVFYEDRLNGQDVLIPMDEGLLMTNNENHNFETFDIYKKEELREMLQGINSGKTTWDPKLVKSDYGLKRFRANYRAEPAHCNYIGSPDAYPRWSGFETTSLPVFYPENGEADCNTANSLVQNAITNLNMNYIGVDLTDGGTHNFVPDCLDDSGMPANAQDDEFATGNARRVRVMFNDPCEQIEDLDGCSGTLAVGGLYWYGTTHIWDDRNWNDAAYGYVIVNNGVGACNCSGNFVTLLTHELTHTLGIGHIEGDGTANMNPSCCNDISVLDRECLDYTYLTGTLPIELISFEGILKDDQIMLSWETEKEVNNAHFEIERSVDSESFNLLHTMPSKNNLNKVNDYLVIDANPGIGENIYRLFQIDLDGQRKQVGSPIIIQYTHQGEIKIYPNPISNGHLQIAFFEQDLNEIEYQLIDISGRPISAMKYSSKRGRNLIRWDVTNLPKGIYFLRTTNHKMVADRKILIL